MNDPSEINSNITIARFEDSDTTTSGELASNGTTTISIIISNSTANDIKVNIGVASSTTSISDIEYLGGKKLITGTYRISFSEYIQSLYNDGSEITSANIAGDTSKPVILLNESQSIMLDDNGVYRYYGNDPSNYVEFNGELWRIISVSNIKADESDTIGEMRVKLVRSDSIGTYSWDSSALTFNLGMGANNWPSAVLMTELNTLYLNKQSGTCYNGIKNASTTCDFTSIGLSDDSKLLIDDALWYLGASSTYESLYANDYYSFERGTTVYACSGSSDYCPRATEWVGLVGLMYPSDYAYATDLSLCTQVGLSYDNDTTNCLDNNWLYTSNGEWLISPLSNNSSYVFYLYSTGDIRYQITYNAFSVRPTVYLKSDVFLKLGTGSSTDPYQLSIN